MKPFATFGILQGVQLRVCTATMEQLCEASGQPVMRRRVDGESYLRWKHRTFGLEGSHRLVRCYVRACSYIAGRVVSTCCFTHRLPACTTFHSEGLDSSVAFSCHCGLCHCCHRHWCHRHCCHWFRTSPVGVRIHIGRLNRFFLRA